jgi:hypothetical protein
VPLALGLLLAALAGAQDLDSAARELARKIESGGQRQEINALTVRNASSLTEAEAAQVARVLETEIRVRPARPGVERVTAQVTLSENVQSYLWVAAIGALARQEVILLSIARPPAPAAAPAALSIRKRLLWEQDTPILDAAVSGPYLVVLDATAVSFYRDRQLAQSLPVSSARHESRDTRGRLTIDGGSFRAALPDVVCNGTMAPSPAMVCAEGNTGMWALGGKNYFSEPGLPPYYSSATLAGGRLLAGLDGHAHLYDSALRETGQWGGWGSDIAAVDPGCGDGRAVLATKPGDWSEPDAIQLYNVGARGPAPASEPATFSGPVTALWPENQPGAAVAIARNPETGRYAAYSLAITCDR